MTDKAIEAGASIVTDEMVRVACAAYRDYAGSCKTPTLIEMRVAIEAAIASGALVPASAVVEMRERCAAVPGKLPITGPRPPIGAICKRDAEIADAIRQLDLAPACGDRFIKEHPVGQGMLHTQEIMCRSEWAWRGPIDAFPGNIWEAKTSFGFYIIEECSASDCPAYEVRFRGGFVAVKDNVEDAKVAAQADYEQRIRSAIAPASGDYVVVPEDSKS